MPQISKTLIAEIKRKYSSGKYSQNQLALEYDISQTIISAIVRGVYMKNKKGRSESKANKAQLATASNDAWSQILQSKTLGSKD